MLANERTQAKGAADYADLVLGTSAAACANGAQCSAGEMVIAAAAIGILEFDAAEIVAVNKIFNTTGRFGFANTVIANMHYREGTVAKVATVIRDIAGGHLFGDGNKRTAQFLPSKRSLVK